MKRHERKGPQFFYSYEVRTGPWVRDAVNSVRTWLSRKFDSSASEYKRRRHKMQHVKAGCRLKVTEQRGRK